MGINRKIAAIAALVGCIAIPATAAIILNRRMEKQEQEDLALQRAARREHAGLKIAIGLLLGVVVSAALLILLYIAAAKALGVL